MLDKIVRRLGLGSPEVPSIPGMQTIDWRLDELKTGNMVFALCHEDSVLHVVSYEEDRPEEKRIEEVDLTLIYPSFKAQFAIYRNKNPQDNVRDKSPKDNVSVKRAQILPFAAAEDTSAVTDISPSLITTHEAAVCDRLSLDPHPNLVEYLGVQVNDELEFEHKGTKIQVPLAEKSVTGLVFAKYDCTLDELVIRRVKFDVKRCVKSIAGAIQYLHQMTLVHGNLNPHNVLVKRSNKGDQFVLADFSSTQNVGRVITLKTGQNRWCKRKRVGIDRAEIEDDWYAFGKLIEWLVKEKGGKVEDFAGLYPQI